MSFFYNPEWRRVGDTHVLQNAELTAVVQAQITRDYGWKVYRTDGYPDPGVIVARGSGYDRAQAMNRAEIAMGYNWTVEPEYEIEKGCRCMSCWEPTGRWQVSNREDTVNLYFPTEGEAIAWLLENHATAGKS